MIPQATDDHPRLTQEHLQAAAADSLLAARAAFDKARRGRDRAVRAAAAHLSRRRISEITGWDRGTVRRILDTEE